MRSSIAFAAALAAPLASASGLVTASGGAVIINQCSYDIPLNNVPATIEGSGAEAAPGTISKNGGQWSTPWVQLPGDGGWSVKLNPLDDASNPMQFEYTYQPDGTIWWDLSFVNVPSSIYDKFPSRAFSPGDADKYYRYPTDDAHGMQSPVQHNAWVTMTLCTGGGGGGAAPAPTTTTEAPAPAAPTTTVAPAPAPTTLQTSAAVLSVKKAAVDSAPTTTVAPAPVTTPAPTPAPAAVVAPAADDSDAVVVTEFETKIVTAVVTEVANARRKRHAHGHAHHGHPQ